MENKSDRRLSVEELERGGWYIERVLMLQTSSLALTGLILGVAVDRRWMLLPGGIVLPFLFLRAARGWRPPVQLLRRIGGVRKHRRIDDERLAFKALRRPQLNSSRI